LTASYHLSSTRETGCRYAFVYADFRVVIYLVAAGAEEAVAAALQGCRALCPTRLRFVYAQGERLGSAILPFFS
jgi:hypothetical protein